MDSKVAFCEKLAGKVSATGIIAVLVVEDASKAVPLARALYAGGVQCMELTLRTPSAMDALKAIVSEVPEMTAGVGTVLTPEQVEAVAQSGAAFAVSPGVNRRVLEAAAAAGLSFAPGIATPSDIETALEYHCRLLKFFPAEPSGGLPFLKSAAAPYAHLGLQYIPLGGVNEANLVSYVTDPLIAAVGGSWLAPKDMIKEEAWESITHLARSACEIISGARGSS